MIGATAAYCFMRTNNSRRAIFSRFGRKSYGSGRVSLTSEQGSNGTRASADVTDGRIETVLEIEECTG